MKNSKSPLRQSTRPHLALRAGPSRLALGLLAAGACTLLVPPKAVHAEQYSWKPDRDGSWFESLNWRFTGLGQPGDPPGPNDEANITFGGTARIATGGTAEAKDLFVGRNSGSAGGTIAISNGTLKANQIYLGLGAAVNGEMTVDGGQSRVEAGNLIYIGQDGNGTMRLSNNGSVTASGATVIGFSSGANGQLSLSGGSTYTSGRQVVIGLYGNGTMNVSGGSVLTAPLIRSEAGAQSSRLTVDGGTLRLSDSTASLFRDMPAGSVQIGTNGMTLDVQGFDVSTAPNGPGIEGSGRLTKTGRGFLTLTSDNTYTGGTTVADGRLTVGDGGTSGSIVGDVNLSSRGAGIVFDRSDTLTFGGAISGSGYLGTQGSGELVLTGGVKPAGGTTIFPGARLRIGDGSTGNSFTGNVNNSGTLIFNRAVTKTYDEVISGPGGVEQAGPGTTILTNANTYTGGTTISGGTLQLGRGGSIVGNVANEGWLDFDQQANTIFSGVISGSGSVKKQGTGSVTLTGENTYTGGTTISGGSLIVGNGGTSGSIVGDVVNNGTLTFSRADNVTFDGVISGTGGVVKTAPGTLRLTGTSTYAGPTVISLGELRLDGSLTTSRINVIDPGPDPTTGAPRTPGRLSGSGSTTGEVFVQAGAVVAPGDGTAGKTLTVGDLSVRTDGIIEIDAREESGTGLVADRLVSTGTATFGAQASGFGDSVIDVKFDAAAKIPALEGIRVIDAANGLVGRAPRVTLDPASLPGGQIFTLDLEATNLGGTFAKPGDPIPAGAGGAGFVVLQVQNKKSLPQVLNAQYLVVNAPVVVPPTPVVLTPPHAPTLVPTPTVPYLAPALVKGPAANVTTPVNHTKDKGQTGIVVQNHGVQVGGTVTPQPQSATGTPVSPTTIPVGTGNSVVTVVPPTNLGTTNFISVTGSYTNVSQTNAQPGTTYRLLYAPHSVDVYKTPTSYGNLAPLGTTLTSTQSQVGNALTSLLPAPYARPGTDAQAALVSALYPLSVAQIPGALDSVSGEGTDPTFVTAMNSRLFQTAIEDRLQGYRGSAPTPGLATGANTGSSAAGALATDLPVSRQLWGIAVGSFGSGDYLQDADLTTGGFVFGADGDLGDGLVAGAALGYVYTSIDPGPGGSAGVASLEAAGYAHWTDGPWFATGLAGLGYHWLDIDRAVAVGDLRDTASSSPDGWGVFVATTAGRRFDLERGVTLEPMVGLRYDHVWRDSFDESGAAFANRAVDGESLDAAQAFVGARLYTEVELDDGMRLWPEFNAGYAHEIGNTDIVTGASLVDAPGSSFTVTTEGPGDDVGLVGVRLSGMKDAMSFFVDYHAELRSEYTGHVVRAGVSVPF